MIRLLVSLIGGDLGLGAPSFVSQIDLWADPVLLAATSYRVSGPNAGLPDSVVLDDSTSCSGGTEPGVTFVWCDLGTDTPPNDTLAGLGGADIFVSGTAPAANISATSRSSP